MCISKIIISIQPKGSLFFGLQVGVAALCGADFILSLALIIIISIGVRGGRQQTKSTTSQVSDKSPIFYLWIEKVWVV